MPFIYVQNETIDTSRIEMFLSEHQDKEYDRKNRNIDPLYDEEISEKENFEYFYFDPNNTSWNDWKKLGVKDHTIKTIQKYLASGARFKNPEDLSRIYNLDEDTYNRIKPYCIVRITREEKDKRSKKPGYHAKDSLYPIDINLCNAEDLMAVRGIGEVYSRGIINYRNLLGGYISVEQLLEVYGIDSTVFSQIKQYLIVNHVQTKKISVNIASEKEMARHPYINFKLAGRIVNYRTQNGPFRDIEDLFNEEIMINDSDFMMIKPYLRLWPE